MPISAKNQRENALFGGVGMGRQVGHRPDDSIEDRFFRLVDRSAGCWLWTGDLNRRGYGRLQFNKQRYLAHRVSFEIHKGPIRGALLVCHTCDNPKCVNPNHLFLGNHAENMRDCMAKGRFLIGERSPNAKLTDRDVKEIRRLHALGRYTHDEIAAQFNTSRPNVTKVINRYRWART